MIALASLGRRHAARHAARDRVAVEGKRGRVGATVVDLPFLDLPAEARDWLCHLTRLAVHRPATAPACSWLLGIEPPVTSAQLQAAYRARIAQAHPDLHLDSEARTEAAERPQPLIDEARDLVSDWIAADRDRPALAGSRAASRAPGRPSQCPLRSAAVRGRAPATSRACGV